MSLIYKITLITLIVQININPAVSSEQCSSQRNEFIGWVLNEGVFVYKSQEAKIPTGLVHPGAKVTVCSDAKLLEDNRVKVNTLWADEVSHPDKAHNINGWIFRKHIIFANEFKKGTTSTIPTVEYAWGDVSYSWEILLGGKLKECNTNTYESINKTCRDLEWSQRSHDNLLIGSLLLISDSSGSWCFSEGMMLSGFCDANSLVGITKHHSVTKRISSNDINGDIAFRLKLIMEKSFDNKDYDMHFSNDLKLITSNGKILYLDDFHKMNRREKEMIMCGIDYHFTLYKWQAANASPRWVVNIRQYSILTPPYVEVGDHVVLNRGRIWFRPKENNKNELEIFKIYLDDQFECG